MKVTLATGIYPPDIGGPATYVRELAHALQKMQVQVQVITYGKGKSGDDLFPVIRVPKGMLPIVRWFRFARALKKHAADADIVYAFSSVSVGMPLWIAHLRHPKKILRLGGDFRWERYTDKGGALGLAEWYEKEERFHGAMNGLLKTFDHIVFSTEFQQALYEKAYRALPLHNVIENSLPGGMPSHHAKHAPFKLLFLGRFVPFKNIGSLLHATKALPDVTLTLVGDGPLLPSIRKAVRKLRIGDRVDILPPQRGDAKKAAFRGHDLMVIPSYTDISPNAALEARCEGLPVLLTAENGLSRALSEGMLVRRLQTPRDIQSALEEAMRDYGKIAERCAQPVPERTWDTLAREHLTLFQGIL